MSNLVIGISITAIIGFMMYREFFHGPIPYIGRTCTGRAWKKAFPDATKEEIRLFLECLVSGMALSSKIKLKFHPNDQAIDIYRSLYGGRTPAGDNMECETFVENLSSAFDVKIEKIIDHWHDEATLGELFKCVKA